jgi:hypothetical protein
LLGGLPRKNLTRLWIIHAAMASYPVRELAFVPRQKHLKFLTAKRLKVTTPIPFNTLWHTKFLLSSIFSRKKTVILGLKLVANNYFDAEIWGFVAVC